MAHKTNELVAGRGAGAAEGYIDGGDDYSLLSRSLLGACLSECDLDDLLPVFESSKIDYDLFVDLTDQQLAEVLPADSYPLGIRWKISKYLKTLKQEKYNLESSSSTQVSSSNISGSVQPCSTLITEKISSRRNVLNTASETKKEIGELDLEDYLNNHHDGKCLLKLYETNESFSDDERGLLVEIVAKLILFHTTRPTKADFLTVQTKILQLFPSEERIYYIPPKEEGVHQRLARGKLFDKVRNLKEWMRSKGLITTKKKDDTVIDAPPAVTVPGDEEKKSLEWLKYNREPWVEVEIHWSATWKYRSAELKLTSKIEEYLSNYKVLTQRLGYTLIESDFSKIYPNHQDAIFSSWSQFKTKLCVLLKDINKKYDFLVILCESLEDAPSEDVIDAVVIQSLPSLIVPNRKVKLGTVLKKPSIEESRDSFILYVKTPTDLEPAIEARRTRMSTYGKGATIQPYIAVVGDSRTNISSAYVCINNIVYKQNSILKAVDICFKSFFALDLAYPAESEQVWLAMQKVLYGITLPTKDKKIFNVSTFINKLARISTD